ncbi:MAG: hypothetical protein U1C74_12305 [Phenylobacterium sp.]|nr:hypothetical protein [Phenylobacterium sp.]
MSCIIRIPDGYGGFLGDRQRMRGKPGSHVAYARSSDLVVEWYDFGGDADYESANLLIFDRPAQKQLLAATGELDDLSPTEAAGHITSHFQSYFAVKDFAVAHNVPFATETDFQP